MRSAILALLGAGLGSVSAQSGGCADVTGDGTVNVEDLLQLLSGYAKDASGDVDGDGSTNVEDLLLLLASYGSDVDCAGGAGGGSGQGAWPCPALPSLAFASSACA